MLDALNAQINSESYSSFLYLSMSAHAENLSLKGFAHWFRIQAEEEMGHAMKLFKYVIDRRGVVKLAGIEGPPTTWPSALAMFEAAFKHEQMVSDQIYKLADLAVSQRDHATHTLLEWFLSEQVEEEAVADNIVQQLKMVADAPDGVYLIDRELSGRTASAVDASAT
jgi:ferritin